MATFAYLNPTGSNLSNTNLTTGTWTRLTFTRNNRPILYTNYPEALMEHDDTGNPDDTKGYALADNGYYINRQTVSAGEKFTFDYQTIVAAHGSSITFHEWSTNNYT